MLALAYCIVLDDGQTNFPEKGVLASKLEIVAESGLSALSSQLERNSISNSNFQQAALEFHRAVHAVFTQKAVVPFRFPTWLNADELKAHLRQESIRYKDFLLRHRDHVQMEVRVVQEEIGTEKVTSGAEHLRARAAQFRKLNNRTAEIKALVADTALEWRERENAGVVRLYALVSRKFVEDFREKLNRASLRTSGPWPATEFLEPHRAND